MTHRLVRLIDHARKRRRTNPRVHTDWPTRPRAPFMRSFTNQVEAERKKMAEMMDAEGCVTQAMTDLLGDLADTGLPGVMFMGPFVRPLHVRRPSRHSHPDTPPSVFCFSPSMQALGWLSVDIRDLPMGVGRYTITASSMLCSARLWHEYMQVDEVEALLNRRLPPDMTRLVKSYLYVDHYERLQILLRPLMERGMC